MNITLIMLHDSWIALCLSKCSMNKYQKVVENKTCQPKIEFQRMVEFFFKTKLCSTKLEKNAIINET